MVLFPLNIIAPAKKDPKIAQIGSVPDTYIRSSIGTVGKCSERVLIKLKISTHDLARPIIPNCAVNSVGFIYRFYFLSLLSSFIQF